MSEFTEKIEEEEEQEEFATEDVVRLKLECECNNNEDSITKICQKIESLNKNIENRKQGSQRKHMYRSIILAIMLSAFIVLYIASSNLK